MKLSIYQVQQLDYLLKLMPVFCKVATKDESFPSFQLVVESDGNEYIGDFIEFVNDTGTLIGSLHFGKTNRSQDDWELMNSLKAARERLQQITHVNQWEYNGSFPYNRLAENPDILLSFLIGIVKDIDIETDESLPLPVIKNANYNGSSYPFVFFNGTDCRLIGLIAA